MLAVHSSSSKQYFPAVEILRPRGQYPADEKTGEASPHLILIVVEPAGVQAEYEKAYQGYTGNIGRH
jgi:ribosomal protein L21E